MTIEKIIYTAHGSATGGRNGHAQTDDGVVKVQLSVPKAMGGPGAPGATNPEQLFAIGYSACFAGACEFVARSRKLQIGQPAVSAAVGIGPRSEGGFGIKVDLQVKLPGLSRTDAESVANEAHSKICPYSHATRGNVDVSVTVVD